MNYKAIKLLALAVLCGSSLIAASVSPREKELLGGVAFIVTAIWFILYWLVCSERTPRDRSR